jgi:hypothetical protein
MVFNATFNNISAISWAISFIVEETRENYRPVKQCTYVVSTRYVKITSDYISILEI